MYTQEIQLSTKLVADKETLYREFHSLLISLRNNGQVQGDSDNLYFDDDKISSSVFTLAKDALHKKYNTPLIEKSIRSIEEIANAKLQIKLLGKSYIHEAASCNCTKSEYYILFTTFLDLGSPVRCGTCNHDVPLYKLPLFNEYGYVDILHWESNYKACDALQMNCTVGEMWAMKQMWDVNSQLSKQGIAICKKITDLSHIPTYYYLFNYRKIKHSQDIRRKCPCCNCDWLLQEKTYHLYDFKCDTCKLISSLSSNSF
ncbi:MAG: DUF2310 family Zn-ribbon-containing protein [Bacteroidota bacterium]